MNLRDLFLRVRALAAPRRVDRELDEELAFHIERASRDESAPIARLLNGKVPEAANGGGLALHDKEL